MVGAVVAGWVVHKKNEVVVGPAVVVVAAAMAIVELYEELVGWPACWRMRPLASSYSSGPARHSLG